MNQTDIDKLKAEHGKLVELSDDEDTIIVKVPTRPTWKRFRTQILDESKRPVAVEDLVRACVVVPDKAGLDAIFDRKPGFLESILKEIQSLAGATADLQKKIL